MEGLKLMASSILRFTLVRWLLVFAFVYMSKRITDHLYGPSNVPQTTASIAARSVQDVMDRWSSEPVIQDKYTSVSVDDWTFI